MNGVRWPVTFLCVDITREPLLDFGTASRRLGLHIDTLHNWRRRGWLDAVKLGGRWYTTATALQAMAQVDASTPAVVRRVQREHAEAMANLRKMGVKC